MRDGAFHSSDYTSGDPWPKKPYKFPVFANVIEAKIKPDGTIGATMLVTVDL